MMSNMASDNRPRFQLSDPPRDRRRVASEQNHRAYEGSTRTGLGKPLDSPKDRVIHRVPVSARDREYEQAVKRCREPGLNLVVVNKDADGKWTPESSWSQASRSTGESTRPLVRDAKGFDYEYERAHHKTAPAQKNQKPPHRSGSKKRDPKNEYRSERHGQRAERPRRPSKSKLKNNKDLPPLPPARSTSTRVSPHTETQPHPHHHSKDPKNRTVTSNPPLNSPKPKHKAPPSASPPHSKRPELSSPPNHHYVRLPSSIPFPNPELLAQRKRTESANNRTRRESESKRMPNKLLKPTRPSPPDSPDGNVQVREVKPSIESISRPKLLRPIGALDESRPIQPIKKDVAVQHPGPDKSDPHYSYVFVEEGGRQHRLGGDGQITRMVPGTGKRRVGEQMHPIWGEPCSSNNQSNNQPPPPTPDPRERKRSRLNSISNFVKGVFKL